MQQDNNILNKFIFWLYRIEDIIVTSLLSAILLFAIMQIILRNFFESGFIWGDSLLRILVLWLGLAGAIMACRKDKQISIDVLYQFIPEKYKYTIQNINFLFASIICLVISYYSLLFVIIEYQDSTIAFEKVPAWITESIIPIGFAIMSVKYFIKILNNKKS